MNWYFFAVLFLHQILDITANDEDCNDILFSQLNFTSTSSRQPETVYGPQQATLHNTHAWCAFNATADQHLVIDLGSVMMIKSIAIQGNPDKDEFLESYSMSYGVNTNSTQWLTYTEKGAKRKFKGNVNRGKVSKQSLYHLTAARFLRIHPETWFGHICVRVQPYGCPADPFRPLGMTSGDIPNGAVTASSYWYSSYWGYSYGYRGRLHWTKQGIRQSWIAATNDLNQWLKIDLSRMKLITAVATQSRCSYGQFVKTFWLDFANDGTTWTEYKAGDGARKVFTGNSNINGVVRNLLETVVYSRFVRFHPITYQGHISMRVEIYSFGRASPADLGIETNEVPNSQITHSSAWDSRHAGYEGRLNRNAHGSAYSWCPRTNSGSQWIKFDFGYPVLVTGIITHGRGATTYRWVTRYQVYYSLDNSHWIPYRDQEATAIKMFYGNTDVTGYVTGTLDRDIVARYVKIYPKTWYPSSNILCMQASAIGRRAGSLGSPVFKNQDASNDLVVQEQSDITLQCQAVGDSPISITWSHKGQVIGSQSDLVIENASKSNQGIYICKASNNRGSNTKIFHLEVKDGFDVCTNHRKISDSTRLASLPSSIHKPDDGHLNEKDWYVFSDANTYYRIAIKCIQPNHCQASAPGHLDGNLPTPFEGIVKRKVCFHSNGNCCGYSKRIFVRNCGLFYVYKLKNLDLSWKARYCIETYENGSPPAMYQSFHHRLVLQNHMIRSFYDVAQGMTCMKFCMVDNRCKSFNHNPSLATCELNNITMDPHSSDLVSRPGYTYFYKVLITIY